MQAVVAEARVTRATTATAELRLLGVAPRTSLAERR